MYTIKKIVVALDLTAFDAHILTYTRFLADILPFSEVHMVHVADDQELSQPEWLAELHIQGSQLPDVQEWVGQLLPADIRWPATCSVQTHVLQGGAVQEILRFARHQDIDLIVVGAKNTKGGTGVLPGRLARKSPCSLLFVPAHPMLQMDAILIPTDFSDYSVMSFQEARYFRQHFPDISIIGQNVFRVPLGFYKTGKTYDEFADIMQQHHEQSFRQFIEKHHLEDLNLVEVFTLDDDKNPADKILRVALENGADLVIISAKGHTRASSILLGSTTEKVLQLDKLLPLLVLKEKGETLHLLDILLKI